MHLILPNAQITFFWAQTNAINTQFHIRVNTQAHTNREVIWRRRSEIKVLSSNQSGGSGRRGDGGHTREDTKNETEDRLINSASGEDSHKTQSRFMHLRAELSV